MWRAQSRSLANGEIRTILMHSVIRLLSESSKIKSASSGKSSPTLVPFTPVPVRKIWPARLSNWPKHAAAT
jgi:hypothetical protein